MFYHYGPFSLSRLLTVLQIKWYPTTSPIITANGRRYSHSVVPVINVSGPRPIGNTHVYPICKTLNSWEKRKNEEIRTVESQYIT